MNQNDLNYSGQYLDDKYFKIKIATGGDIYNATESAVAGEMFLVTGNQPALYAANSTSTFSDGIADHDIYKVKDLTNVPKVKNVSLMEFPGTTQSNGYSMSFDGVDENELWKGKADILNHDEKLIIDLKTTADLNKFRWSASKYNYDSQAYIYQQLFGYEMLFIAIDKTTHQIGIFDCSPEFLQRGADKVKKAVEQYQLFYRQEGFDPSQFFINETL